MSAELRRRVFNSRPGRALVFAAATAAGLWLFWDAMHPVFQDLEMYREIGTAAIAGGYWHDPVWNTGPPFFQLFVTPVVVFYDLVPSNGARLAIVFFWNLALSGALTIIVVRALSRRDGAGSGGLDGKGGGEGDGEAPLHPPAVLYLLVWLAALPVLRANFALQQINLVPALLCAIAFARLGSRRDDPWAGALVGLAASIKVAPVLLLPYLWKRWRALGAAIATGIVLALSPALLYGFRVLADATRFWIFESIPAQKGARDIANVSLPGLMHRLVDPSDKDAVREVDTVLIGLGSHWAEALGVVAGLAILALLYALIARGPAHRPPMADLAILMPAVNLAGTVAWQHHLVTLVPTYAAVILYLWSESGDPVRRRRAALLLAISIGLGFSQFLHGVPGMRTLWIGLNAFGSVTISAYLAVAAALLARNDPTIGVATGSDNQPAGLYA